jgi:hypothetical protein
MVMEMKTSNLKGMLLKKRFLVMTALAFLLLQCEPIFSDTIIPVSSGTSVTVFEQTGGISQYTYSVSVLMGTGGTFSTSAAEYYTVISDGMYVIIRCWSPRYRSGHSVGSNIVAARLNGVSGYPEGLWATSAEGYTMGYNGIAESVENALGPSDQIGPYAQSHCTYLGDQHSEIILSFSLPTLDSDGDGIPDDKDMCPLENSVGLDANQDGCIDRVSDLASVIESLRLNPGIENSFTEKAINAYSKFKGGNVRAAVNILNALVKEVEAQEGKKISEDDAAMLIQFVRNSIWLMENS